MLLVISNIRSTENMFSVSILLIKLMLILIKTLVNFGIKNKLLFEF